MVPTSGSGRGKRCSAKGHSTSGACLKGLSVFDWPQGQVTEHTVSFRALGSWTLHKQSPLIAVNSFCRMSPTFSRPQIILLTGYLQTLPFQFCNLAEKHTFPPQFSTPFLFFWLCFHNFLCSFSVLNDRCSPLTQFIARVWQQQQKLKFAGISEVDHSKVFCLFTKVYLC